MSLLKRWLRGTHHGAVTHEHPDDHTDASKVYRMESRRSACTGLLSVPTPSIVHADLSPGLR